MSVSRMTSAELKERLEVNHQETAHDKATKTELLARVLELEGDEAPGQDHHAPPHHGDPDQPSLAMVTGNETISSLKVKCTFEAYKVAKPDLQHIMVSESMPPKPMPRLHETRAMSPGPGRQRRRVPSTPASCVG